MSIPTGTTPYYEDENVTLYHGDCREVDAWLDADVLVTDPPYGINMGSSAFSADRWANVPVIAGEPRTGRSAARVLTTEHTGPRDDALRLWGDIRPAVVFGSWRPPRPQRTLMRLVWDKSPVGQGGVGIWRAADEEIYLVNDWPNDKGQSKPDTSVLRWAAIPSGNRDHPTPKPVGLMEYLINAAPAGVIADPFAGSGTTLLAARNLGRKAIGVELEERYCEVIAKRLDQYALDFGGA